MKHANDHKDKNITIKHTPFLISVRSLITTLSIITSVLSAGSVQAASLVDVYRIAAQRDGQWLAQQAQVKADQTQDEQAGATLLPQLSANGFYFKERYDGSLTTVGFNENFATDCVFDPSLFDPGCLISSSSTESTVQRYDRHGYGVQLNQPLLRLDRWHRYQSSKAYSRQRELDREDYHQALLHRVTQVYLGVLRAGEELRYARAEHLATLHQFNTIRRRYQLGLAGEIDVFEVTAARDVTTALVTTARNNYQNAREDLVVMTGMPDIEANPLPEQLPLDLPQPQTIEGWLGYLQESNPKLQAATLAIEAAKKRLQEAKAGHAPTVDFVANYREDDTGGGFIPSANTTSYGVVLNVPLYEGGGRSARSQQAELQWRAAIAQHQFILDGVTAQVNKSFRNVLSAISQAQAHESAIQSSQLALKSTERGYQNGTRSVLEVVEARRAVFEAKKNYAQTRYQYIFATIDLKRAAGTLNQSDVQTIDSWLTLDDLTLRKSDYDHLFPLDPAQPEPEPEPEAPLENGPAPAQPTDLPPPGKVNPGAGAAQPGMGEEEEEETSSDTPTDARTEREAHSLYEAVTGNRD